MTTGDDGLPVYDRAYNAGNLREVMARFLTSGVFASVGNELSVTEQNGVWNVDTGAAMVNGLYIPITSQTEVIDQDEIASSNYAYIVLGARFDTAYRDAAIYAVTSQSPSYTPVRDASTWELVLARIDWRGGFTDYRLNNQMCGAVAPFEEIDTESFLLSLQTALDQFNLNVGTVQSLPSGSTPTVTVRKPTQAGGDVYIDFGIPRGAPGEAGQSARGLYIQENRPANPDEGTVWMGTDPDTRQIEHLEVYEVTGSYPGEIYPGEKYPGGNVQWTAYTIDPALLTSAQQS